MTPRIERLLPAITSGTIWFRDRSAAAETKIMELVAVAQLGLLSLLKLVFVYLIVELSLKVAILSIFPASSPSSGSSSKDGLREMADNPPMLFLIVAILAPLIEEIVFRGLLYNVLSLVSGFVLPALGAHLLAMVVSALVFSVAHLEQDFAPFLTHFLFGLFAANLYWITGTLAGPILLHVLNNAVAVFLILL